MVTLQRAGGIAALYQAAAFLIGFWVYFTVLGPARYGAADVPAIRHVAFLADRQALLTAWNLVIYIAFGGFLVVLALTLRDRLEAGARGLANVGAAFGLIWAALVIASGMIANVGIDVIVDLYGRNPAEAALVWLSYRLVVSGLGGGNEIVGGLWVLLVSLAGWRSAGLPKPLNLLGATVGIAGLLTTVPQLVELGTVFGLGLILWFAALGILLLRARA